MEIEGFWKILWNIWWISAILWDLLPFLGILKGFYEFLHSFQVEIDEIVAKISLFQDF